MVQSTHSETTLLHDAYKDILQIIKKNGKFRN